LQNVEEEIVAQSSAASIRGHLKSTTEKAQF
jgi:hypothetical protein